MPIAPGLNTDRFIIADVPVDAAATRDLILIVTDALPITALFGLGLATSLTMRLDDPVPSPLIGGRSLKDMAPELCDVPIASGRINVNTLGVTMPVAAANAVWRRLP